MSLDVRIDASDLAAFARRCREVGRADLAREMSAGLRDVAQSVGRKVDAEAGRVMPKSGGYRAVISASLNHRIETRTGGNDARIIVRTYADGTGQRRDVPKLDKGELRHPFFGRSYKVKTFNHRRNKPKPRRALYPGEVLKRGWGVTSIPPGFWSRPTQAAMPLARAEMAKVLDDVADKLARG